MSALTLKVNSWAEVALDKAGMKKLMRGAGGEIARKTRRLIAASAGSGRVYRGGGGAAYRGAYRPGPYRASAPGEAPVRVSGALAKSIRTYAYKSGDGFAVRARQFYALFLEVGASGGGNPGGSRGARGSAGAQRVLARRHSARGRYAGRRLLPRPFLDRVMQQEEANLQRRVRAAIAGGLSWRDTGPGRGR